MSEESSDDIPLAQRPGPPNPARKSIPRPTPPAKPVASQIASSSTPANGATRKASAAVPADEKEAAPQGGAKPGTKAVRKSTAHSQVKGKPSQGAATVRASERSGDSGEVKTQSQPKPAAKKEDPNKTAAAKKVTKTSTPGASPEKVKREKPQYDLPGQTQPTPDVGEPLAKFYLSLLQQRSDSEIAPKWCVQRGLLPRDAAEAWCQKNGKNTGKAVKKDPAAAKRSASKPSTAKAKQRRKQSEAFADDASGDDDENFREDDKKPAKRAKTTARAQPNKQSAAKAKPAPKQSRPAVKKQVAQDSEDDDSDEKPLKAKAPTAKTPAAKAPAVKAPVTKAPVAKSPAAKPAPAPRPKPQPVPSDSDSSDAPLAQKKPSKRA